MTDCRPDDFRAMATMTSRSVLVKVAKQAIEREGGIERCRGRHVQWAHRR